MSDHDELLEDLEPETTSDVKGGVGADVTLDGRTIASAEAGLNSSGASASASAGDVSADAGTAGSGVSANVGDRNIGINQR